MKKLFTLAAAATALFTGRVSAADSLDLKYFTVKEGSAVIEELSGAERGGTVPLNPGNGPSAAPAIPGPGELPQPPSGPQINPPFPDTNPSGPTGPDFSPVNNAIDTLDKIVNLADKIWSIIERNQPVVNISTNYANAVPFGTTHWTQLQGWSKPSTRRYAFTMKNLYGSEVVKVVYQVHWTHSGNFQGKGKFLTGVTVEPLSVTTAWGYKVDLASEVPDSTVANVGTQADPVASMQVQLKWKVHTAVKDIQEKAIYYVQGDGFMKEIGSPFTNGMQTSAQKKIDAAAAKLSDVKF